MKQVFQQSYLSRQLRIDAVPCPTLENCGILVENKSSLISSGTERAIVSFARKNFLQKLQSKPEQLQLLLRKMRQHGIVETLNLATRKLSAPIPLGYSTAGIVLETSADLKGIQVGQRVACMGAANANHAEVVYIPKNLFVPLPDALSFEEGSFVAPGAIALHSVRLGKISLSEVVVVIGLGLIGQLTLQLVKAQGGIAIGVDLASDRLEMAKSMGADSVFSRADANLQHKIMTLTAGRGADVILITAATSSDDPVILAGELARDKGRVIIVGDVGMKIPRALYYQKELSIKISRSYGPGRYDPNFEENGQDYPQAYVRWTERDNMSAFLELAALKKINLQPLITHRFSLEESKKAYQLLTDRLSQQPLGIILNYGDSDSKFKKSLILSPSDAMMPVSGKVNLGLIGSGNFTRSIVLPILEKSKNVNLLTIASHSGLSAKMLGQQYRFSVCTTDVKSMLNDANLHAVLIATRHDSHSSLICEALKQGKHVFVEKPLATTPEELNHCIETSSAYPNLQLMVGFNRRFAPFTQQLKSLIKDGPINIHYRINAGFIPENSWIHQHGGRVVGEICHFVDWCLYVSGSLPNEVYAKRSGSGINHNLTIQLQFKNDSVASIQYLMSQDTILGKERIEVYTPDLVAEIDDFKKLRYRHNGQTRQQHLSKPDKGHLTEISTFLNTLQTGSASPVPILDAIASTQITFSILDSLKHQKPIFLDPLPCLL